MNHLIRMFQLIVCLYFGSVSFAAWADQSDDDAAWAKARDDAVDARYVAMGQMTAEEARARKAKRDAPALLIEQEENRKRVAEKEQIRIRQGQLKSGAIPISNFDDAELAYEPKKLWGVMGQPLLKPDKGVYQGIAFIDEQEDENTLRVKISWDGVPYYATLLLNKKTVSYASQGMRINGRINVIGRYVKNKNYITSTAPVIEVMYIGD